MLMKNQFSTNLRGGATPLPRRAQPLLLLFRSDPPTEGGGGNHLKASSELASVASSFFFLGVASIGLTEGSRVRRLD